MTTTTIMVITKNLATFSPNAYQIELEDNEGKWVNVLLLAIVLQARKDMQVGSTMCVITSPARLIRPKEVVDRYFTN